MGRPERVCQELRDEEREPNRKTVPVEVYTRDRAFLGWFADISAHGCGIASLPENHLLDGESVVVSIPPRSMGTALKLYGVVRHSNGWRHGIQITGRSHKLPGFDELKNPTQ